MLSDLVDTIISPFTGLLGDWFWAIIFCVIIGGIYIKSEDPGPPVAATIIISVLMAAVLGSVVRYFFAIMAGIGFAAIVYFVYRGRD